MKYEITQEDGAANMLVHDAEKSDAGTYSIFIENETGQDSLTFNISIQGIIITDISYDRMVLQ